MVQSDNSLVHDTHRVSVREDALRRQGDLGQLLVHGWRDALVHFNVVSHKGKEDKVTLHKREEAGSHSNRDFAMMQQGSPGKVRHGRESA